MYPRNTYQCIHPPKSIQIIFIMTPQIYMPNYETWRIDRYIHCLQTKAIPRDKNTPIISCGQIVIQMKWNSSLSIETDVRAASRLTAQLRSEKWFNIGVNSVIRARYTTVGPISSCIFILKNITCIYLS